MTGQSLLTEQELLDAVNGTVVCRGTDAPPVFTSVVTDSRNVTEHCLFVPLVGEHQDGHAYIPQAAEKGASVIFAAEQYVSEHADALKACGCFVVRVGNTLTALQRAAAAYTAKFPALIKIGITGSCGKTTAKEIAVSVLSQKYTVVANEGNLNSETGLPLSVFKIRKEHQVGIFEMGMNRKGEIAELASVLFPDFAVITNIGTAHIGILGTRDAIAEEKKHIFMHFTKKCTGFIPAADKYAGFLAAGTNGTMIPYGAGVSAGIGHIRDCGLSGTRFELDGLEVTFPLCGAYNFSNALAVVELARRLELSPVQIKKGLEAIKTPAGRAEIHSGDYTVVMDCYNANPDSMEASLSFFGNLAWNGRKAFVLGDMLELGAESEKAHIRAGTCAAAAGCNLLVFFGSEMTAAAKAAGNFRDSAGKPPAAVWTSAQTDDDAAAAVAEKLAAWIQPGDLVLFKGSRGMRLERISDKLPASAAQTGESGTHV